ncbi:hypothetical protein K504DRAFT_91281 [Pleomassaria siparia CBS 279.74]|uniref:Uncharacterized protein n=1 Tax=Pleomassaria siparia CBS 279.74 TaxID=1314801 RepID=A0A6G1JXX5_9PLEO|nr:hypothetical protein K504DRAFT_91281 [Pleomassaria siparia CBS 279.74]
MIWGSSSCHMRSTRSGVWWGGVWWGGELLPLYVIVHRFPTTYIHIPILHVCTYHSTQLHSIESTLDKTIHHVRFISPCGECGNSATLASGCLVWRTVHTYVLGVKFAPPLIRPGAWMNLLDNPNHARLIAAIEKLAAESISPITCLCTCLQSAWRVCTAHLP